MHLVSCLPLCTRKVNRKTEKFFVVFFVAVVFCGFFLFVFFFFFFFFFVVVFSTFLTSCLFSWYLVPSRKRVYTLKGNNLFPMGRGGEGIPSF